MLKLAVLISITLRLSENLTDTDNQQERPERRSRQQIWAIILLVLPTAKEVLIYHLDRRKYGFN